MSGGAGCRKRLASLLAEVQAATRQTSTWSPRKVRSPFPHRTLYYTTYVICAITVRHGSRHEVDIPDETQQCVPRPWGPSAPHHQPPVILSAAWARMGERGARKAAATL